MDKNSTHEGENLRKILARRYNDLQAAADALGYNYTYLSARQNEQELSPKFKKKICKLLSVPLEAIEQGTAPPVQAAEPSPNATLEEEVAFWRAKALAALEEMNAILKRQNEQYKKEIEEMKGKG